MRLIPSLEARSSFLDGNYTTRTNPIEKCINATLSMGYDVFAIQNNGQCRSSIMASDRYRNSGAAEDLSECGHDGKGGPYRNQVYEVIYGKYYFPIEIINNVVIFQYTINLRNIIKLINHVFIISSSADIADGTVFFIIITNYSETG